MRISAEVLDCGNFRAAADEPVMRTHTDEYAARFPLLHGFLRIAAFVVEAAEHEAVDRMDIVQATHRNDRLVDHRVSGVRLGVSRGADAEQDDEQQLLHR